MAATFSPELVDATIYVIDVAEGDKIPRKGGPGITASGLLVINKIDLAPYVGADLQVMDRDAGRVRKGRPYVFTNLKNGTGVDTVPPGSSTICSSNPERVGRDGFLSLEFERSCGRTVLARSRFDRPFRFWLPVSATMDPPLCCC